MSTLLQSIQTWLGTTYDVVVPVDWLSACVEWIQQESQGQLKTAQQIQMLVLEQWLAADLRELEDGSLPPDVATQTMAYLTGTFCVQVNSMLDIGLPLFGQLQKVKGTVNANSEISADKPHQPAWEPKPSRMMLLSMTDGRTEVKGMEYKPISSLTSDLKPGFKMVVYGPVMSRHGILMLTPENVRVLGGEVENLTLTNIPSAVLQEAMERNAQDNGKHEKKEFSGRFISRAEKKMQPSVKMGFLDNQQQTSTRQGGQEDKRTWNRAKKIETPSFVKEEPIHREIMKDEWNDALDDKDIWDDIEDLAVDEMELNSQSARTVTNNLPIQTSSSFQKKGLQLSTKPICDSTPGLSFVSNISNTLNQKSSNVHMSDVKRFGKRLSKDVPKYSGNKKDSISSQISAWVDDFEDEFDGGSIEKQKESVLQFEVTPRTSCAKKESISAQISSWIEDFDDDFDVGEDSEVFCRQISCTGTAGKSNEMILSTKGPRHIFREIPACTGDGHNFEKNQRNNTMRNGCGVSPTNTKIQQQKSSTNDLELTFAEETKGKLLSQPGVRNEVESSLWKTADRSSQAERRKLTRTQVLTQSQETCLTEKPPASKQSKLTSMLTIVPKGRNSREDNLLEQKSTDLVPVSVAIIPCDVNDSLLMNNPSNSSEEKYNSKNNSSDDKTVFKMSSLPTNKQASGYKEEENSIVRAPVTLGDGHTDQISISASGIYNSEKKCQDTIFDCNTKSEVFSKTVVPKAAIQPFDTDDIKIVEWSSTPCQTLIEVKDWLDKNPKETTLFTVKGHIATLTSNRLCSGEGKAWSLTCRITDEASTLEVALADHVLRNLIGFSAKESLSLRQMVKKDPQVKKKLAQGLQACQTALKNFYGLMDIQISDNSDKPTITKMRQLAKMQR